MSIKKYLLGTLILAALHTAAIGQDVSAHKTVVFSADDAASYKYNASSLSGHCKIVDASGKDIFPLINASLSGGELKRIEIATLLARHTRLSVFDEPEAGIDLWSFQNLIRIFEKMRKEIEDSSIVIISHQERILNIADEILLLSGGTIQDRGTPADIMPKLVGQSGTCVRLQ